MRRFFAVLLAVALLVPATALADHGGTTIEWTALLPPHPAAGAASEPSARCGRDGLVCVRDVERRLAQLEARFGCDHRAVFATTYRLLTGELRRELERRPAVFDDPAGVGLLAAAFYELYARVLADHAAGRPVPGAWRVALDAARSGDHNAGQDMLLAISAHVQRDMPFAIAAVGLRTPSGASRKPDHDRVNRTLSRAYDRIVPEVAKRYDPFMHAADATPSPVDDVAALQMVAAWREAVWRNAERLVTARSDQERGMVRRSVEQHAEGWARGMAAVTVPGYRAGRDAYCLRQR